MQVLPLFFTPFLDIFPIFLLLSKICAIQFLLIFACLTFSILLYLCLKALIWNFDFLNKFKFTSLSLLNQFQYQLYEFLILDRILHFNFVIFSSLSLSFPIRFDFQIYYYFYLMLQSINYYIPFKCYFHFKFNQIFMKKHAQFYHFVMMRMMIKIYFSI
ncbi:transmembrane protein, putative (macronuclear) [Tetrahymena thermophila SB210]|uniref:Transmembrane protein, putative n=1 Tax=Tetrahymena thermophila (strain SB210) TaxID=312017 RepID=W7XER8_TETTS|nr:transmembrane protein, putative [Tetrahymena thermophila SB210]EWS75238.1 transmembrane protein, putative [Tetrahymena thermophila SB210]|eukprot:XP_012652229.1 transmembrane protein, putative [Tetrahymena thermophila SB210]